MVTLYLEVIFTNSRSISVPFLRPAVEKVSDRKTLARIAAKEEVSGLRDTIARKLIKKDMATLPYGLREVFFKLQRIGIDKGIQAHYGYLKAGMQYRVKKYQYGFKGADYGINTLKVEHLEVKFRNGRGKTVLRMKFSGQAPQKEEKFYVGKLEKTNQVEIDFNSICKKLLKPLRENHRKLLWTTTRACLE